MKIFTERLVELADYMCLDLSFDKQIHDYIARNWKGEVVLRSKDLILFQTCLEERWKRR